MGLHAPLTSRASWPSTVNFTPILSRARAGRREAVRGGGEEGVRLDVVFEGSRRGWSVWFHREDGHGADRTRETFDSNARREPENHVGRSAAIHGHRQLLHARERRARFRFVLER